MKDLLERFRARDAAGKEYLVELWQRRIDTSTMVKRSSTGGLKEFVTADGQSLNWIDDNTFELVIGGTRLTRVP